MKYSNFQVRRPPRGIALVIVLGFLVLITVLIVAYFTSVTTESSTAKTYANGAATKFLADSAVNIVMGQIAKGTQGQSAAGERLTWASQPGMIRTYGTSSAGSSGNYAEDCYKLYSSPQMVIPATTAQSGPTMLQAMSSDVPATWNTEPAFFTDLNAPVTDSSGHVNFPIMDGNNMKLMFVSGTNAWTYDSVRNSRTPDIEGVYVQPSFVPNYSVSGSLSTTNTPVPMPVQWLYVLKNGAVISPDPPGTVSTSGSTATFRQTTTPPTSTNPIVGRIAFWTDDETCKLNINTTAEGTYYDQPHMNTQTDMEATTGTFGYAISPPATGEYNRYPGHPASTCLSVALGTWMNSSGDQETPNAYTSTSNNQAYLSDLANYLTMLPRSGTGGSCAGTVAESGTAGTGSLPAIVTPTNRIFASFDELMFNPARNPNLAAASPGILARAELEELKFFLTPSSRAPELTPFNTPKVSMWPQWMTAADRYNSSAYYSGSGSAAIASDGLLAFCSSFGAPGANTSSASGKFEYFIQRQSAGIRNDPPASYNSCTADWVNVPRNQQLANYLCDLGSLPIPGYGAAFTAASGTPKYNQRNFSNIVLEAIDFIRSVIDKLDYTIGNYEPCILPLVVTGTTTGMYGALPGVTGTTTAIKGYGVYPVCTEFVLGGAFASESSTALTPFVTYQCFLPGQNPTPASYPPVTVDIYNLGGLGVESAAGQPLPNPTSTSMGDIGDDWQNDYGSDGGMSCLKPFMSPLVSGPTNLSGTCEFSGTTTVSGTVSTAFITLGSSSNQPVTFVFPSTNGGSVTPAQQISVNFPAVTIPAPTAGPPQDNWLTNTFARCSVVFWQQADCSARGLEVTSASPINGDWRLVGGFANIPPPQYSGAIFVPCGGTNNYFNQNYTQVHSFRPDFLRAVQPIAIDGSNSNIPTTSVAGSLSGLLTSGSYMDESAPLVPPTVSGSGALMANGRPGDWDTGAGLYPDGPYVNPVDRADMAGTFPFYSLHNGGGGNTAGGYVLRTVTFSPNREVASPVRFGSLPTGICGGSQPMSQPQPWQTLLFCPNPAGRQTPAGLGQTPSASVDHYGFTNPPDHLFLEFFTMPIVQPYAISEPFSTAGKVNLNYQLAPFTYIERSTALRGVLKNTLLTGISANDVAGSGVHQVGSGSPVSDNAYKWAGTDAVFATPGPATSRFPYELRYDINRDATIAGIEEHYFNQGQLFMYPSQICDVFLVPQYLTDSSGSPNKSLYNPNDAPVPQWPAMPPSAAYDSMVSWWNATSSSTNPQATMALTGDNLREEPYDRLYPRLTTKSNTYTVHYRVQVLQKAPASNPAVWTEGQDVIASEYRGSSLIERYVDPNDPSLNINWDTNTINLTATPGGNVQAGTSYDLSQLYKFRVISTKKFAP